MAIILHFLFKNMVVFKNAGLNGFPKIVEKPVETVENDVEAPNLTGLDIQILIGGKQYSGTVYED